jgi:predicted O-methyltransferase YrrM
MHHPAIPHPPSSWRDLPAWNPARLLRWTLPRRWHEIMARVGQIKLAPFFSAAGARVSQEQGSAIEHTAVTTGQLDILLAGVAATEKIHAPVIEIGSYRGLTTRAMARATQREVWAIDPYLGDGGHPRDLALFEEHAAGLPNVRMLRMSSDRALAAWGGKPVSFVFIDAIHEYVHAWYDFAAWSPLLPKGGIVAFHDVDLFPGVNRVCQKLLREHPEWRPWGYAPNIALFQRA